MCIENLDCRLLNRAGLALRALTAWFAANPGDVHPTNGQLASQLASQLAGQLVDSRTIARGLKDLHHAGLVTLATDPTHPVGRRIGLALALPPPTVLSGPPDRSVAPPLTELSRLSTLNVVQDTELKALNVRRDKTVTPDRSVAPPDDPSSEPGALAGIMARLKVAIGPEYQERLPIPEPAKPVTPRPMGRGSELRLAQVLARLESPECDDTDLEWAIGRLTGEFGPSIYRPFYRKVCESIRLGREPLGLLMTAIGEAMRDKAKNRGACLIAAIRRTMPTLGEGGTPAPGINRQATPGAGAGNPSNGPTHLTNSARSSQYDRDKKQHNAH